MYGGTTATATMGQPLGLSVGSTFQVTVSGASPSVYDGTFNATYQGSNVFQYTLSSSPSSNASGTNMTAVNPMQVSLSSLTYSGTTATGTSSTALGLSTGTQFELSISGASPSTYDGTFTATVTGSTTFTYTLPGNPGSNASGTIIAGLNLPTLDGTIGRVTGMQDQYDGSTPNANDTAVLETYQYLGLNTIVQENRPQPGIDLTYIQQPNDTLYSSDGGDRYTGLDRFGRVADQYWTNVNAPASPTDRFQYGYDQNGNVLYKNNLVNSTFSELYHANSTSSGDNRTAYDSLNRLQGFRRGTLSASGNNGSGGLDTVSTLNTISDSSNSWNYDALGNQTSTQGGSQTRTFNAQNQIASISGLTTPTYDNNGNMTKDQAGNTYTYNAWNQLVSSSVKSEVLTYTATGLLLTDSTTVSGTTTKRYFFDSPQGQVLEDATQVSGTTSFDTYVWGLGYVDDLVARDAGNLGAVTRTYVQQDVNHNVTALIGSSGGVLERFTYDPYGSVTVLTSAWATTTDSQNWVYYFQGGRYNANIGFYYFRSRWYNPTTATWMSQDPTGTQYVDGANLYQFADSNPVNRVDPSGLLTASIKVQHVTDIWSYHVKTVDGEDLGAPQRSEQRFEWAASLSLSGTPQLNSDGTLSFPVAKPTAYPQVENTVATSSQNIDGWINGNSPWPWSLSDVRPTHDLNHCVEVVGNIQGYTIDKKSVYGSWNGWGGASFAFGSPVPIGPQFSITPSGDLSIGLNVGFLQFGVSVSPPRYPAMTGPAPLSSADFYLATFIAANGRRLVIGGPWPASGFRSVDLTLDPKLFPTSRTRVWEDIYDVTLASGSPGGTGTGPDFLASD